jgi:hypothetical protein
MDPDNSSASQYPGKSCPGQTNELYSFILWHFGGLEKALETMETMGWVRFLQVVFFNHFKVIGSRERIPQNWMGSYWAWGNCDSFSGGLEDLGEELGWRVVAGAMTKAGSGWPLTWMASFPSSFWVRNHWSMGIFCGDIPLHGPFYIYGRYLQSIGSWVMAIDILTIY